MVKIQSQKRHTRIVFKPLSTSCELECLTPHSPLLQTLVINAGQPHYDPNRSALSPTVVFPDVRAHDDDGVFVQGPANAYLSTLEGALVWELDGNPIETSGWKLSTDNGVTGDYWIDQTPGDHRGTLKIYKNIPPEETHTLRFKGRFVDPRTNLTYKVESNVVRLSTSKKGDDTLACNVLQPHIKYDPLLDRLLVFDYKKARGLLTKGETRESCLDNNSYEHEVKVDFSVGKEIVTQLPADIRMELALAGQSAPIVPSAAHPEIISIGYPVVKIDLRMIPKGSFEIRFMRGSQKVAWGYFDVEFSPSYPTTADPTGALNISPRQKMYVNSALLNLGKRWIEFPELYYDLAWFTQGRVKKTVKGQVVYELGPVKAWQHGENMAALIAEMELGNTYKDACFDLWFDVEAHPVRSLTTDEAGNVLTDENGNFLID